MPEDVIVDFNTASGDLEAADLKNEIEASTASGNVTLKQIGGDVKLSTASGDIELADSDGEIKCSTASGDVEISLAKTLEHDLRISSASGDAILNFGGNEIKGFIEMSAREDRGRIRAPFKFDEEETVWRHDQEYMLKTVQFGTGGPTIEVRTASGTAEIKK